MVFPYISDMLKYDDEWRYERNMEEKGMVKFWQFLRQDSPLGLKILQIQEDHRAVID